MRVEWYKPPRRNTLPLLLYSVNPGKTLILKVMVCPRDDCDAECISFAVFGIDGRFMFDTRFGLEHADKAIDLVQDLLAEKNRDSCVRAGRRMGAVGSAFDRVPTGARAIAVFICALVVGESRQAVNDRLRTR